MRIGIMLPNWIGDVVMATPALRALRAHYSCATELVGIQRPYVAEVLDGTGWFDDEILYDHRSKDSQLHTRAVIGQLRRRKLDEMILLASSFRSAIVTRLAGIKRRVGFAHDFRGPLLTQPLRPQKNRTQASTSVIDDFLRVAEAVGCQDLSPRMQLATRPEHDAIADQIWQRFGFHEVDAVICFQMWCASSPARIWPAEYFTELAVRLAQQFNVGVLVLCGPKERENAAGIERAAKHPRVKSMAEADTSIGVMKAVLKRSQLMISTDSGPRHVAAAFDVPVIGLFGSSDPAWTRSSLQRTTELHHQLDCWPCGEHHCPLVHQRCLRDLSVTTVFEAARTQLATAARRMQDASGDAASPRDPRLRRSATAAGKDARSA